MNDEQHQLLEIREARRRRLRALQLTQAHHGISTPPEVLVEIEGLQRDLGLVESVLLSPLGAETITAIGATGQYQALDHKIDVLRQRLDASIERLAEHLATLADRHDDEAATRREWQAEQRDARRHQWRAIGLLALAVIVLVAGALLVAALT